MTRHLALCLLGGSAALCCAAVLWHVLGYRGELGRRATTESDAMFLQEPSLPPNESYHLIQRKRAVIGDLLDSRLSLDEAVERFEALNRQRWPDKGDRFLREGFPQGETHRDRVRLQVLAHAEAIWREERNGPMPAWMEKERMPP